MAKFEAPGAVDSTDALRESELWRSLESVEALFNTALPRLKCPICEAESFTLIRDFAVHGSPQVEVYNGSRIQPVAFVPTIAINCNDCGHFLFFSEEDLLKRAERKK
jgi:hypothetical protein